ncbi:RNA polymerase sigma factor [Chitinophaga solisilvae]|uniref:Sigma-70 family RNA polymerase sigma factor n=1 Tax=Chitinophaga solisilvae TaxID=1233460 RepID=A0A3S1B1P8_9BACT|nr:sigma-70 family RNA polymerase sigma factor [Chitinophaga solisilvae]NSL90516.1 sigma-70 family RNA polymerase sigma factor [Chitinophaga solisilvae]
MPEPQPIFADMPSTAFNKEQEFTELYLSTQDRLYQYLCYYTRDKHLVQDLMQQCYLKIWERMPVIRDSGNALSLLKTIARNLLTDVIRRRMKEDTQWLEAMKEQVDTLVEAPGVSARASLQALDIAIDRLPDNCREVYLLHREEGLSYREISFRLSISVSMVEKHMSKAIRLLKQDLLTDYALLLLLAAAATAGSH